MKKTVVKKPKTKGVAKVPVIMQLEALECGAACLTMVMAYYGKWVPLEQVRSDCGVSRDGSKAKNILIAARTYGFEAKGFRWDVESLRNSFSYPCIIHWNFNHFVVLNGFKGKYACINDPGRGLVKVTMDEFDKSYTGVALKIVPAEGFEPSGKPKILIFDEATSALDNRTQKMVSDALDKLKCTRIVIAHRLSTIKNCDRILVLDKGIIQEDGTYEELIAKKGLFAELVERQRLDNK